MAECKKDCELADNIKEIKQDIREIKIDLSEHMSRTAANEARVQMMEDFIKESMANQQKNFDSMLANSKDNIAAMALSAKEATLSLNRQLKISLGIFAALAILVGAFAKFFV